MLKVKIFTVLLALKTLVCGCNQQNQSKFDEMYGKYRLVRMGTLDRRIDESSGLCRSEVDSLFYTHNDGNIQNLFLINKAGQIKDILKFKAHFGDVEDITADSLGNLYICDVGNNLNNRPNVSIYTYNPKSNTFTDTVTLQYPDQKSLSPKLAERNFDCEAVFYFNDSLYLFSKNRGYKQVNLYKVPTHSGKKSIPATIVDKTYIKAEITAADINPAKSMFAILTYGYVYIYGIENNRISFKKPLECRKIGKGGQMEAICFINNSDLLITNEQGKIWALLKK